MDPTLRDREQSVVYENSFIYPYISYLHSNAQIKSIPRLFIVQLGISVMSLKEICRPRGPAVGPIDSMRLHGSVRKAVAEA